MAAPPSTDEVLFVVNTPLGFTVRTTVAHWHAITTIKHPVLKGREVDVQLALRTPDQVRISRHDKQVYLFYRSDGKKRWVCAGAKRLNGQGFLITAYRTSNIKEGKRIWP